MHKMEQCLLVLLLVMVLLLTFRLIANAETAYVDVSKHSTLNGREKPTKRSDALSRFDRGDELTVLDIKDGWAKIDECGEAEYCFVSVDYLCSFDDLEEKTMKVCSNGRVRIRKEPNGKKIVGYVKNGNEVSVRLIWNGWALTQKGWISCEYLVDMDKQ